MRGRRCKYPFPIKRVIGSYSSGFEEAVLIILKERQKTEACLCYEFLFIMSLNAQAGALEMMAWLNTVLVYC